MRDAELEREIRTTEVEVAIRRQTLNLPNPHTDLVDADEDEEAEDDDDDQSSQEAQVSQSSEPDLERQVEDLNARLDLLRSAEERKRGLLRRIQDHTAAAVGLQSMWYPIPFRSARVRCIRPVHQLTCYF